MKILKVESGSENGKETRITTYEENGEFLRKKEIRRDDGAWYSSRTAPIVKKKGATKTLKIGRDTKIVARTNWGVQIRQAYDFFSDNVEEIIGIVDISDDEQNRRQFYNEEERSSPKKDAKKRGSLNKWEQEERLKQMRKVTAVYKVLKKSVGSSKAYEMLKELGHLGSLSH